MSGDKSQSMRTQNIHCKTIATFHLHNPTKREMGNRALSSSELLERKVGETLFGCCNVSTYCSPPGPVENLLNASGPEYDAPLEYRDRYPYGFDIRWSPATNAAYYTVVSNEPDSSIVLYDPGTNVASIYYNYAPTVTVSAVNRCGTKSASVNAPCFLAGSVVQMANGDTKSIEDVRVGDLVLGAFGEHNTVLALHRPLLGEALMCKINDEHTTTNHHPHISLDKQFYSGNPELVERGTYGRIHKVIDEAGALVDRMLFGLKKGRVQQLVCGINLKTVDGFRNVSRFEIRFERS